MRDSSALPNEFESLKNRTDAHRRGFDFQPFVGRIFQAQHFRVEKRARAAKPRQIDLFATRGDEVYLIETKWRQDPANSNDIGALYSRLEDVPSSVVGILVSYAGFTDEVLQKVQQKSNRPVLLVSGVELEAALGWSDNFIGLLKQKKEALLVHRTVLIESEPQRRGTTQKVKPADLPASTTEILFPNGDRSPILWSGGEFGRFTFVTEMPDIDWHSSGGWGVTVDLAVPLQGQNDFLGLIKLMAETGWVSTNGNWSIQQATRNWHGFGTKSLCEALQGWKQRYEGLETHHTEELCYFDAIEEGYYTLTAAISADSRRIVWRAELSFQLVGIPLDTKPLQELCERFGIHEQIHFRPRNEKSVNRTRPPRNAKRRQVTPVAFVVAIPDSEVLGDEEWVVGIVIDNPFIGKEGSKRKSWPQWVPDMLRDSEYLICSLRSWHQVESIRKYSYELWEFESSWTSDALLVRGLADWRDEDEEGEEVPPSLGEGSLEKDGVTLIAPGVDGIEEIQRRPRKRQR
jgi:sRNA-binding regulator protein Hfq